jgi:transcriptional regulator with XRE-family HTH domain
MDAKSIRLKLGMNQKDFWKKVCTTQSGGSRYESGRNIPASVQTLIVLAYGNDKDVARVLEELRGTT